MTRIAAFILALALTLMTVSSTCLATPGNDFYFTLRQDRGQADFHASISRARSRHENNWDSSFSPSQLSGLDPAAFRAATPTAIHFALIRESGRLDCSGRSDRFSATGTCAFQPNPAFARALAAYGIRAPGEDEWVGLLALDVRTSLIDAIAAARYPVPTVDDLIAMTAVGVTGPYVQGLARAGYRPASIDSLVSFKAVGVDPLWIGGLVRAGYSGLPNDDLIQLRAMGVDAPYIQSFAAVGYRHLRADQLVELKAVGVTADFAARLRGQFGLVSPDRLVELKAIGLTSRDER